MWQKAFVRAVLRHRWVVLLGVVAASAAAVVGAARLRFETDLEVWFLEDDPTLISYREFKDRFGGDRIAVVGVVADELFRPEVLAAIDRLTRAFESAPHVNRVLSLTTARVAASVDGAVEITDLISEIPESLDAATALRSKTLGHPLLSRNLISEDGRATAIVVELTPEGNRPDGQREFVTAARGIVEHERRESLHLYLAGSPILAEWMIDLSQRDFALFGPLGFVLLVVVGFVVFRRISAALIPLPVVTLASLWMLGLMGFLGMSLTIISPMLVMVILAVAVADSIHVLADYYRRLMEGREPREAVEESVADLLVPCFCTSATTVGGFLSLRMSDLQPLGEFGALAAVGVTFAFVLSVTLVPVILHFAHPPDPAFVERQRTGPMSRFLDRIGRRSVTASRLVLIGGAVLVAAGAAGALQVHVVANPLNFFKESNPMRRDTEAIDEAIGGTTSVEFLIEGEEGVLQDPAVLARLDDFERWLEARPGLSSVLSAVDLLKDMDRVLRDRAEGETPESRRLAAQYYLLLEGEDDFDKFVQSNYSVGRMTARANLSQAATVTHELPAIEREMAERFGDGNPRVEATGFIRLVTRMDDYIIRSQIRSFLLAIVVITVIMMLILRSPALGLFSLIPNLVPIVLGLAFMAAAGIPLDQGTVMTPSIALGLVVDDAVHFLYRYRSHVHEGLEPPRALHRTMTETGRPIVVTSLVLFSGFVVLVAGSFNPAVYFGLISALVMLAALAATLILLPAALLVLHPKV